MSTIREILQLFAPSRKSWLMEPRFQKLRRIGPKLQEKKFKIVNPSFVFQGIFQAFNLFSNLSSISDSVFIFSFFFDLKYSFLLFRYLMTFRKVLWGEYEREDKIFGTLKLPIYVIDYHQSDKLIVICPKLERFIVTTFNEIHQRSDQSDPELDILPSLVFDLTVQCTPLLKDEGPLSSSFVQSHPNVSLTPNHIN
jgi:hypothetical protein